MKNLILTLVLFVAMSATSFGQIQPGTTTDFDNSELKGADSVKVCYYLSAGISISNTGSSTFGKTSYPSIEFGGMYDNFGLGLVAGRGNLDFHGDAIQNYWYEVKTSFNQPIGPVNVYGLFGIGNYISTKQLFIEYGVGMSISIKKYGIFVQSSNWDGIDYISTGLTYNF
jgi:hypothetical protein